MSGADREPTPEWLAKFAEEFPEPEESAVKLRRQKHQGAHVKRHKAEQAKATRYPDWMQDRSLLPKRPPTPPKPKEEP